MNIDGLKARVTKRNEVFEDLAPKIQINLTINIPDELKDKAVESQEKRSQALKEAIANSNKNIVQEIFDRMKKDPIYVKSSSDHIGGGA